MKDVVLKTKPKVHEYIEGSGAATPIFPLPKRIETKTSRSLPLLFSLFSSTDMGSRSVSDNPLFEDMLYFFFPSFSLHDGLIEFIVSKFFVMTTHFYYNVCLWSDAKSLFVLKFNI